jgi:hypothetical protein
VIRTAATAIVEIAECMSLSSSVMAEIRKLAVQLGRCAAIDFVRFLWRIERAKVMPLSCNSYLCNPPATARSRHTLEWVTSVPLTSTVHLVLASRADAKVAAPVVQLGLRVPVITLPRIAVCEAEDHAVHPLDSVLTVRQLQAAGRVTLRADVPAIPAHEIEVLVVDQDLFAMYRPDHLHA